MADHLRGRAGRRRDDRRHCADEHRHARVQQCVLRRAAHAPGLSLRGGAIAQSQRAAALHRHDEDIERIEVLLGPASALYGPNSSSGVLHVITKSPFTSQGTTLTVDGGERSIFRGAVPPREQRGQEGRLQAVRASTSAGQDWKYTDRRSRDSIPRPNGTPGARDTVANVRDFERPALHGRGSDGHSSARRHGAHHDVRPQQDRQRRSSSPARTARRRRRTGRIRAFSSASVGASCSHRCS